MTTPTLSIGDFAKATHISVKMLRHYHHIGLLEPADVDSATGYRRYTTQQLPVAQVIRRFRDLQMPLEEIRAVLSAPDVETRNRLIASHLDDLRVSLEQTQVAVAELRNLLEHPASSAPSGISHRLVEATPATAISEMIGINDAGVWWQGALGELYATMAAQGVPPHGAAGGIYADELFADEVGRATIFIPCESPVRAMGRVEFTVIPAAELATIVHAGSDEGIDLAYGALAAYVASHELAVEGAIREYYLVSSHDTHDPSAWRTEIGWPIFRTGTPA
jgi:DNA-binding transcriptional MerR regulator/effector-binding domain-containing protein